MQIDVHKPAPTVTLTLTDVEATMLKLAMNNYFLRPVSADNRNKAITAFRTELWGRLDQSGIDSF